MAALIATIFPFKDREYKLVENLMHEVRHASRFVPRVAERQGPGRWSRETTAAPESGDDTEDLGSMDSLQLQFGDRAYRNGQGIMFGTHRKKCDIPLPNMDGISKEHCYLTYDDKNRLVLKDISSYGTIVTYDGQGEKIKKRRFTWILGGDQFTDRTEAITIQIHKYVKFRIVVPKHNVHSYTYANNVATFNVQMEELREGLQMDHLDIDSWATTIQAASRDEAQTAPDVQNDTYGTRNPVPTASSIVLVRKNLGHGAFGSVDHVWDVSTGLEYARKCLTSTDTSKLREEAKKMKFLEHVRRIFAFSGQR